ELTALRLHLAGREIAGLRTRLTHLDHDRRTLASAEREVKGTLARLDTDVLATENRLAAVGGADLAADLAPAEQLPERARGVAAVVAARQRAGAAERDRLVAADARASLVAEQERLEEEAVEIRTAAGDLLPDVAALEEAEARLAGDRAACAAEAGDDAEPAG